MHEERDSQILKDRAKGLSVARIAKLYDLSARQVWRILEKAGCEYQRRNRPARRLAKAS